MARDYDWTGFDIHFYYRAPLASVWRAWATSAGLCSFFIERATASAPDGQERGQDDEFVAGDRYRWDWRQGFGIDGEILAVEPRRRLAFTFGAMRVDVDFHDTGDAIRVRLAQSGIGERPADWVMDHLNCRSCWVFFMTNLVSILGGGADLRDADPARVSSMEVGFVPPERTREQNSS